MKMVAGDIGGGELDLRSQRAAPIWPTLLASCFALGLVVGYDHWHGWIWLAATALAVIVAAWLRWHQSRGSVVMCALAAACFGASWMGLMHWHVASNDIASWMGEESVMVYVEGTATASPEFRHRTGGSLAIFDYRQPSTYFPMRVDSVFDAEGNRTIVTGKVYVKIDDAVEPFRAGDRVRIKGFLVPFRPPLNPGEFDIQAYARSLGQAGLLVSPDRRLVHVTPAQRNALYARWLDFHDSLRRQASAMLLTDLPDATSQHRDALLKALVLGQREPDLDALSESFQRVGIAHLMAISGLHLGMIVGMVLLVVRLGSHLKPWHGWLMIAVVLAYLVLVDVRLPVLRAGVMTMAACLGLALGRYLHVGGLVALSSIGLLLWRPDQLYSPGFQLSFGVVLGLIHLQPVLRERWFGPPDMHVASSAEMLGQWLKSALTTASVAWFIATPIVMYHFGIIAPLGIVMSVPGIPIVAMLLALGYAKLIMGLLLPSAGLLLGVPLSLVADATVALVMNIDALPGSVWNVPHPGVMWTLVALLLVILWCRSRWGWRVRRLVVLVVLMALWLYWPVLPIGSSPALRLDMLAVGDGTCIVLQGGGKTVVFDAGSSSSLDAGRRWIVPAMQRLNIRRIDAIAISHPDLDHYSAVLELVDAFTVDRVLVTPQLTDQVRRFPNSAVAYMTDGLMQRGVLVEQVAAGKTMTMGDAQLVWLHPKADDDDYSRANEHSMVIKVHVADRRVLLTGDLEREGIAHLLPRQSTLRADILELPHHGSFNELAVALVEHLEPSIVLQSTGYTRWMRDQWMDVLQETTRLVTVRDGAIWVEIDKDGQITLGTFIEHD